MWEPNVDDPLMNFGYRGSAVTWGPGRRHRTDERSESDDQVRTAPGPPRLDLNRDLPELRALLQPLQRGARLGERIHPVHHGPQLPLSQPPHHLRILGEVAHRRAHDRPVIPEEASEIDRDVGA